MSSILDLSVSQTEQLCEFSRTFHFLLLRDGIFAKNVEAIFFERVNDLWSWPSCKLRLIHCSKQRICICLKSVLTTHGTTHWSSAESSCSKSRLSSWEHVSTKLAIWRNSSKLSIRSVCSIWLCSWHVSTELTCCSELLGTWHIGTELIS